MFYFLFFYLLYLPNTLSARMLWFPIFFNLVSGIAACSRKYISFSMVIHPRPAEQR